MLYQLLSLLIATSSVLSVLSPTFPLPDRMLADGPFGRRHVYMLVLITLKRVSGLQPGFGPLGL